MNTPCITPEDMIFKKSGGGLITAGGFKIDSILNKSPIQTGGSIGGTSVLSSLKGLAVPAGLLYMQQTIEKPHISENVEKMQVIGNSLYDNLLNLAEKNKPPTKKRKKTRKKPNKKTSKNKSRKSRK